MPSPTKTPAAATYATLFPEQLADRCAPDALEANSGPVAYLHALYQQALALEATSESKKRFTLAQRRPDIGELLLNQEGLEKQIPPLTLSINALTRQAQSHAGAEINLAQAISQAQYSAGLPFHYPLAQIQAVLRHDKLPLFELLQTSGYTFPNFCYAHLRTEELRQVMRTSSGFSPELQNLLLDNSPATGKKFLAERFGTTETAQTALEELSNAEFFCKKTGLKPEQLQDLLATSGVDDDASEGYTSVKCSSAYKPARGSAPSGHLYGAAFINNGVAPALSLEDKRAGPGITLAIKGATAAHLGRIHKLVHLQHALKLPFADVDLLLMSALRAEGQTRDFKITENTLRALGVFRYLNEIYAINAEQFAALIHEVSPYAVGENVPFLDRVLDGPGARQLAEVEDRLSIDGSELDLADDTDDNASQLTIGRLCLALGTEERLARNYLEQATSAHGLSKPAMTLALVSSLYRLSRLPRLLRLPASEGNSLITILTLSNNQFLKTVAGKGNISDAADQPDILDALVALANLQRWLRRNRFSPKAVLAVITPSAQTEEHRLAIDKQVQQVFKEQMANVNTSRLTEEILKGVNIASLKKPKTAAAVESSTEKSAKTETSKPLDSNPDTWLELLAGYLDEKGFINTELTPEAELSTALTALLNGKLEGDDTSRNEAAVTLASLLTNRRVEQEDLAKSIVAQTVGRVTGLAGVTSEYALPLLKWVGKTPLDVLHQVITPANAATDSTSTGAQPNSSFELWTRLARHALAVRLLSLSPAGLEALVEHTAWFDLEQVSDPADDAGTAISPIAPLNLDLLYQLSCYRDWISACAANNFNEKDALDYLSKRRDSAEPGAIHDAVKQLAKLIDWDEDETLAAVPYARINTPAQKVVARSSLEAYLQTLLPSERAYYNYCDRAVELKGLGVLISKYHYNGETYANANAIYRKFVAFLDKNPGPIIVHEQDYLPETHPDIWAKITRNVKSKRTITLAKYTNVNSKTFDDFLDSLSVEERQYFDKTGRGIKQLLSNYHSLLDGNSYTNADSNNEYNKFLKFIKDNPGTLKVTQQQYDDGFEPERWARFKASLESGGRKAANPEPLKLEVYSPEQYQDNLMPVSTENIPVIPSTVTHIDLVMRLQKLCEITGLSCQSLRDIALLGEQSTYEQIDIAGKMLLGACSDDAREVIEDGLQEAWRDALAAYLMGYWVPYAEQRQLFMPALDDLSSYFLTDVLVSSDARKTATVSQAIASLQHYLYRLFSHLEPGYEKVSLALDTVRDWQQYLSHYGTWKAWRAQLNHPENLIYYASRPNKSAAFKDLEVEVNQISQGRLDTQRLQTAVLSYLTKFERLSNLHIVSGYLDGSDPKSDTYYLIGKTNTSPTEYYWRSVDMGLRDDQQRLSPLAWSEWEKITLPVTGQLAQSRYEKITMQNKVENGTEVKDAKGNTVQEEVSRSVYTSDAIRPVIIAGRPYVFWVERSTTDLPSNKGNNQTLAGKRKISVQYVYRQSDGFWSPANELMSLDGTKNGKRVEDTDSHYLKDENYIPGLIAFVNVEDRPLDPWLTVILYDCNKNEKGQYSLGDEGKDYFIEMRDLLLLERKKLKDTEQKKLATTAYNSYQDIRTIQHIYNGRPLILKQTAININGLKVSKPSAFIADAFKFKATLLSTARKTISLTRSFNEAYELKIRNIKISIKGPGDQIHTIIVKPSSQTSSAYENENENEFKGEYEYEHELTELGTYTFELIYVLDSRIFTMEYTYNLSEQVIDESWHISIINNDEQAQYLDLSSVSNDAPKLASDKVRLNTLFGKQLVARATESIERALGWETQKLQEPTIDAANTNPPVDFHGANGLYFRELFLHLPALIATRLTEQQQFEDAEVWYLRYLFDPYRAQPDQAGRPAHWNTRPLAEVGSLNSELLKPVDPTSRAFTLSRYYRQSVFLALVENWQQQGDHYYRQLTLSGLNHAWLCYQQAMKLVGPLPERTAVSRWSPLSLSTVTAGHFRVPINQRVTGIRNTLENRLYNLRHGLTINGKTLPNLGWAGEGADPFASARGAVSLVAGSYNSERAAIPAYRFRQLLPTARTAARQLADFGRHYMKLMEDESEVTLSTLLTAQEIRLCDFTLKLQQEAINAVQAGKRTLELGRSAVQARKARLQALLDEGKSPMEEAATGLAIASRMSNATAVPLEAVAAIQEYIPTIFGMAFGGSHPGGGSARMASTFRIVGDIAEFASEQLLLESDYERRASEWDFELQQAQWDMQMIDQQIAEANIELNAANISLAQARQERANLEEAYEVMTTGFVIIPIYNWLVSRQELMYGAAYDAVLSLCLGLEAAWRYEIGDYTHEAFIKTRGWNDSYKGMLAGESLLVDLQEMENAYLLANERRLTIKRTFSLKQALSGKWQEAVKKLAAREPLVFSFKAEDFDKDYPGHYLRQIKHVSVSFVLASGAVLNGLSAILTQTSNTTLVKPESAGAEYLYTPTATSPASIKRNLRAQQQIALSSSTLEDGLGFGPNEWVYELMFHDGRYLPFEGTGAISDWQLQVPGSEFAKSLINANGESVVTDIQLNLVYTAQPGDSALVDKITTLRKDIKT
ncbi:Tc toxin subunit A [Pseudomonas sp. LP_7_YM]|uniref:Tc toxin subunit A-related protein n=1 Tax=Pseudomonas sp. LP_7_YM TaxID=2485137 RepID=UPI0010615967|nr:neuraminidase-like domain-containing protein [Pseudomonas sp. LP_7_YM]TDV59424.1 virulence plasmid A protein [Pseudomonas sp. LP_7_YM]